MCLVISRRSTASNGLSIHRALEFRLNITVLHDSVLPVIVVIETRRRQTHKKLFSKCEVSCQHCIFLFMRQGVLHRWHCKGLILKICSTRTDRFTSCYLAVSNGVDIVGVIQAMGLPVSVDMLGFAPTAGTFVIALAVNKVCDTLCCLWRAAIRNAMGRFAFLLLVLSVQRGCPWNLVKLWRCAVVSGSVGQFGRAAANLCETSGAHVA